MNIVTDLTAQSASFFTVLPDVCQRKGVLFCEEANEEKFWGDIIDFPNSGIRNERELIRARYGIPATLGQKERSCI